MVWDFRSLKRLGLLSVVLVCLWASELSAQEDVSAKTRSIRCSVEAVAVEVDLYIGGEEKTLQAVRLGCKSLDNFSDQFMFAEPTIPLGRTKDITMMKKYLLPSQFALVGLEFGEKNSLSMIGQRVKDGLLVEDYVDEKKRPIENPSENICPVDQVLIGLQATVEAEELRNIKAICRNF